MATFGTSRVVVVGASFPNLTGYNKPAAAATKYPVVVVGMPLPTGKIARGKNLVLVTTVGSSIESWFPPRLLCIINNSNSKIMTRASSYSSTETEKLGIKIVKNPPESKLSDLGVRSWPKWGCPPSNFPWAYSSKETCYLLKGKVKVYPDGSDEGVQISAGDLVVFPEGMSCTWDVSEAVDKHYKFD